MFAMRAMACLLLALLGLVLAAVGYGVLLEMRADVCDTPARYEAHCVGGPQER